MAPARVVVFMDYQNVHGSALRAFWPRGTHPANGHIDPYRLGQLIVQKRTTNGYPSRLAQVRIYRGAPNPRRQPAAAAANDRQSDAWTRSPKVLVRRRPLRYPTRWPHEPAVEKGIDVALAVDVLRLAAVDDSYDVGVVLSGDTDLVPAIEAVQGLKCGHIEVAAWRGGGGRLRIDGTSSPWCRWLDESDYRAFLDPTDYSRPHA
ncbi:NYN domain-containing protein [Sphaerimonospora cavernae]|uniref:NYN domain-containing protein n=1 Tax=Sphaerimonospora cavernae TaxID=1740611 RepID=A0ABV6U8F1_9ACTN